MLNRLLCTNTSTLDAASTFYKPETTRGMKRLVASTEARLAARGGLTVTSRGSTPAVLRAAVTEGRARAGKAVGTSAGSISGDLLGRGGGGSSCLGGGSLGGGSSSHGSRRTAACAEARLTTSSAVVGLGIY